VGEETYNQFLFDSYQIILIKLVNKISVLQFLIFFSEMKTNAFIQFVQINGQIIDVNIKKKIQNGIQ
jgi:hypothetical protein